MHYPTGAPFGTLVLDTAWAIKKRRTRADEGETSVCLTRGGAIGPILSDERVHSEFGCIQRAVEVDLDRL